MSTVNVEMVVPSIGESSGGVGIAVKELSKALVDYSKLAIGLKCLEPINDKPIYFQSSQSYKIVGPSRLGYSPTLVSSLKNSCSAIIHQHGVWTAHSLYGVFGKLRHQRSLIVSPHGMLDAWILSRGKLQKNIARLLYESKLWRSADYFHALTDIEADGIKKLIPKAKIEVIPNGIDVGGIYQRQSMEQEVSELLFLGRLHHKKNYKNLIEAVVGIPDAIYKKYPFRLSIVGWGDDKSTSEVKRYQERYPDRVRFLGAKFGADKADIFRSSVCFILPSYSEGHPMAVLEAWLYGCATIFSDGCNMSRAFEKNSALETGLSVTKIQDALIGFLQLTAAEKLALSRNGQRFLLENYSWDIISKEYVNLYNLT